MSTFWVIRVHSPDIEARSQGLEASNERERDRKCERASVELDVQSRLPKVSVTGEPPAMGGTAMQQMFDFEKSKAQKAESSSTAYAAARAERAFVHAVADQRFFGRTFQQVAAAYEAGRAKEFPLYNPARGLCAAELAGAGELLLPWGDVINLQRRSAGEQARLAPRVERAADALMRAVARCANQNPEWARDKRELLKANDSAVLKDLKALASRTEAGVHAMSDMLAALTRAAKKARPRPTVLGPEPDLADPWAA